MNAPLTFYTSPMSRGRIVRWMLEEVGQPYETVLLEYGKSMKSPEYLAINPMGKVPALKHGDVVITEAAAICTYLADAFPQAGLAPAPGDPMRGPFYRWMFFAAGPVEASGSMKALGYDVPENKRGMVGFGSFGAVVDTLEYAVSQGDFLLGAQFSAVDVYLGAQIGWGVQFGTIETRPAFDAYLKRINARPAAQRARAIDDRLIEEMSQKG